MALTTYTIGRIAQMICGQHGTSDKFKWDNFIYRSYPEIQDFFCGNCKLKLSGEYPGAREAYANEVLKEVNGENNENVLSKEMMVIVNELLLMVKLEKSECFLGAVEDINKVLTHSNLKVEHDGNKNIIRFIQTQDNQILRYDIDDAIPEEDLFKKQFPAGLPFGKNKPHVKIFSDHGFQKIEYVMDNGMMILNSGDKIYPNFSFKNLQELCKVDSFTDENFRKSLYLMNQTSREKEFFMAYQNKFLMKENSNVPLLIPQAWIQWHSQNKKDLRAIDSKHADDLYRVDFIAFWRYKRFAILIDDISHYGIKNDNKTFIANEEQYAKRLKEDRKLRKDKWEVFRISNWEIKNELLDEILDDLREFIGF
jgi:hypothetical protein